MDFKLARHNMVQQQVRPWDVLDKEVLKLLDTLPRERFVLEPFRHLAYSDTPLPIGHHQVTLTPKFIGRMLQILKIKPTYTVLEIGTGTGYITALLAQQAKKVISIECIPELLEVAKENLNRLAIQNIQLEVGDGLLALPDLAAFDAIILTGSVRKIPKLLREQLAEKGRLFAVVGDSPVVMSAVLVTRLKKDRWVEQTVFETVIPPLISPFQKQHFKF